MKVNNLIDCNAIEARKFMPVITEFNVSEVALDVIETAEISTTQNKHQTLLRIENAISDDRHLVRSDVGRVKQVLLLLLQNAMNNSRKDSTIHIDIFLDDDGLNSDYGRIQADFLGSIEKGPS